MGCATPLTPAQKAQRISNAELCYVEAVGYKDDTPVVKAEFAARNVSCTPELISLGQNIFQQRTARDIAARQATAQALSNFGKSLQEMGAPRPQTQPIQSQPLNCYTTRLPNGDTATRCN